MTSEASQLLARLASGIRPVGGPAPSGVGGRAGQSVEGASFADLLQRVERGEINSGLPVQVHEGAGVKLSEAELDALGKAADLAQAAGAQVVLVMMNGRGLVLDVGARTVTGVADLAAGHVQTGIDSVMQLGNIGAAGGGEGTAGWPSASGGSLLDMLGSLRRLAG